MAKPRRIKVVYKKIGQTKAWGWAYLKKNMIEVEERLKGKKQMEIIIHECMHILFPDAEEEEVETKAAALTNTLWHEGYRKIDDENCIPLQDGSL
jgi:hypothetical protein